MNIEVLKDWTTARVPMKFGDSRDVRYQVFQNGTRLFQEIRDADDKLIHMLEPFISRRNYPLFRNRKQVHGESHLVTAENH